MNTTEPTFDELDAIKAEYAALRVVIRALNTELEAATERLLILDDATHNRFGIGDHDVDAWATFDEATGSAAAWLLVNNGNDD